MTKAEPRDTLCLPSLHVECTEREERPLRIAIVIERFVPHGGGVEAVAWQVAHELARVGEEVTVVARESVRDSHVPVELTRVPSFWQPLRVRAFDRASSHATSRAPHSGGARFDVIHSFSRTRHQHLYRAGGGSHADYLRRTHGALGRATRVLSPRHRTLLAIEGQVFKDPNQRIQCSSRLVADALTETAGVAKDRILLLPNGVDAAHYGASQHAQAGLDLRAREGDQVGRDPLWLFPGSGWRRKGLDRVMAALCREPAQRHRVWVAGRDDPKPWKRRAQRMGIADRMTFIGSKEGLADVYHAVDAVVLPTRYDPFANVTLEAAAAGRPIVTSHANGAAEWLGDDVRVVQDADDPAMLAAALSEFDSAERRQMIGKNLSQRAKRFGWDQHVQQLREEYQRIIDDRDAKAGS